MFVKVYISDNYRANLADTKALCCALPRLQLFWLMFAFFFSRVFFIHVSHKEHNIFRRQYILDSFCNALTNRHSFFSWIYCRSVQMVNIQLEIMRQSENYNLKYTIQENCPPWNYSKVEFSPIIKLIGKIEITFFNVGSKQWWIVRIFYFKSFISAFI